MSRGLGDVYKRQVQASFLGENFIQLQNSQKYFTVLNLNSQASENQTWMDSTLPPAPCSGSAPGTTAQRVTLTGSGSTSSSLRYKATSIKATGAPYVQKKMLFVQGEIHTNVTHFTSVI